jgi:hypothetical protein
VLSIRKKKRLRRIEMETKKRKTEHGRVELSKSLPFLTTMKNMERQLPDPALVFPKTVVSNSSSDTAGFTLGNQASTVAESTAELEVLKAIINREGYISRLKNSARTISKKFKPDIPDILDFVRAASIDVVEMIVKWREAKVRSSAQLIYLFFLAVFLTPLLPSHRKIMMPCSFGTE